MGFTPDINDSRSIRPLRQCPTETSAKMVGGGNDSGNYIHRMAMEDPIPWYKKPNLRSLYFLLFPCVIGIEMTSGFDSQIINSAQLLPAWKDCESASLLLARS